jgi:hypothetical protein
MGFSVLHGDGDAGSKTTYPDRAEYRFANGGVLVVKGIGGEWRAYAPGRWTEVLGDPDHPPGRFPVAVFTARSSTSRELSLQAVARQRRNHPHGNASAIAARVASSSGKPADGPVLSQPKRPRRAVAGLYVVVERELRAGRLYLLAVLVLRQQHRSEGWMRWLVEADVETTADGLRTSACPPVPGSD